MGVGDPAVRHLLIMHKALGSTPKVLEMDVVIVEQQ